MSGSTTDSNADFCAPSSCSWVDDFDFLAPGCVWDSPDSVAAVDYVHAIIRKEINRGVKAERIFVAGHSQGGILATLAVPKFSDAALGGILMCSSICPHDVGTFVDAAQKDLKVHAMHSPKDALIPYARTKAAYEPLKGGALGAARAGPPLGGSLGGASGAMKLLVPGRPLGIPWVEPRAP